MSKKMLKSYMSLLPKDPSDKKDIKKFRPLSLLNSDYKRVSKILTKRLLLYMGKLKKEFEKKSMCLPHAKV